MAPVAKRKRKKRTADADGRYRCPEPECEGGTAYTTPQARSLHKRTKHGGPDFPCPHCPIVYKSDSGRSKHVIAQHTDKEYPCAHPGCDYKAKDPSITRDHFLVQHGGQRFDCPDPNCDRFYARRQHMQTHYDKIHLGKRVPCPDPDCMDDFAEAGSAKAHYDNIHLGIRHECSEIGCDKTYHSAGALQDHVNNIHLGIRYACPDCDLDYSQKPTLVGHFNSTHLGQRFACTECNKSYVQYMSLKAHVDIQHRNLIYTCRYAPHCLKRFETAEEEWKHCYDENHRAGFMWQCEVPNCHANYRGQRWMLYGVRLHQALHVRNGDVQNMDEARVSKVPFLLPRSELPLFRIILDSGALERTIRNASRSRAKTTYSVEDDTDNQRQEDEAVGSMGWDTARESKCEDNFLANDEFHQGEEEVEEESQKEEEKDDHAAVENDQYSLADNDVEALKLWGSTERLSPDIREKIHQRNVDKFTSYSDQDEKVQVSIRNLGMKCSGQAVGTYEPCPRGSIIDLDTAYLTKVKAYNGDQHSSFRLHHRCLACSIMYEIRRWMVRMNMIALISDSLCAFRGCDQPPLQGLIGCTEHIGFLALSAGQGRVDEVEKIVTKLRKAWESATEKQWTCLPAQDDDRIQRRVQDINNGKKPSSSLVVLDVEASFGNAQLWEISIIELVSGNVLINTTVNHTRGIDHSNNGPGMKAISHSHAKSVYRKNRPNIQHLNVHQIVEQLQSKENGINPETIVLVWATNLSDLRITRNFFQSEGYNPDDFLPPMENCMPIINQYRHNLGKVDGRPFSMKLELLFRLVFPGDNLQLHNHEALADCRQTRLLWLRFQKLCLPVGEEGRERKTIKDYMIKKAPAEKRKRDVVTESDEQAPSLARAPVKRILRTRQKK